MAIKQVRRSKTMRLAALVAALGAAQAALPDVQALIPEQWYGLIGLVIAVAIAVVRVYTTKPLSEK